MDLDLLKLEHGIVVNKAQITYFDPFEVVGRVGKSTNYKVFVIGRNEAVGVAKGECVTSYITVDCTP